MNYKILKKKHFYSFAVCCFTVAHTQISYGDSGAWNIKSNGNWDDNSNWTIGAPFPFGGKEIASFSGLPLDVGPLVSSTIPIQIKSVHFAVPPNGSDFVIKLTGELTFLSEKGPASIFTDENVLIANPIALKLTDNFIDVFIKNGTNLTTIGSIIGEGDIHFLGAPELPGSLPGQWIMNNNDKNTYKGTFFVEGGLLTVNSNSSDLLLFPGNLVVNRGSAVINKGSNSFGDSSEIFINALTDVNFFTANPFSSNLIFTNTSQKIVSLDVLGGIASSEGDFSELNFTTPPGTTAITIGRNGVITSKVTDKFLLTFQSKQSIDFDPSVGVNATEPGIGVFQGQKGSSGPNLILDLGGGPLVFNVPSAFNGVNQALSDRYDLALLHVLVQNGTITKDLEGTLLLDQETTIANMDVNAGAVRIGLDKSSLVRNVPGNTVNVLVGGNLQGFGTLGDSLPSVIVVNAGGTVAPGDPLNTGALTINGSFNQKSDGTLLIKALNLGDHDRLNILGSDSSIFLDGKLIFEALPGATINVSEQYLVIDASGSGGIINGSFAQLEANLPMGLGAVFEVDGTGQRGFVTINNNCPICPIIPCPPIPDCPASLPPSMTTLFNASIPQFARSVSRFQQISDRSRTVRNRMASSYVAASVASKYKRNDCDTVNSELVLASNTYSRERESQFDECQTYSNDNYKKLIIANQNSHQKKPQEINVGFFEKNQRQQPMSIYIAPIASFGNVDTIKKQNGLDYWTAGVLLGADYAFNRAGLGIQFGYEKLEADVNSHWGNFDIDTAFTEIYGTFLPFGTRKLFLDLTLGGVLNWYDIHRHIDGQVAKGNPQGWQWNSFAGIGYDWWVKNLRITPLAAIQYIDLRVEDYGEHGAGDFNVYVKHQRFHSFRTQLGASFGGNIVSSKVTWMPEVRGYWLHEFADQNQSLGVTASNFNTSSQIQLVGGERNYGTVGALLRALFGKYWSAAVSYDFYSNGDIYSHSFYAETGASF